MTLCMSSQAYFWISTVQNCILLGKTKFLGCFEKTFLIYIYIALVWNNWQIKITDASNVCSLWCSGLHVHCGMIIMMKIINIWHSCLFSLMIRTLKICFWCFTVNKYEVSNTLLTIFTMMNVRLTEFLWKCLCSCK